MAVTLLQGPGTVARMRALHDEFMADAWFLSTDRLRELGWSAVLLPGSVFFEGLPRPRPVPTLLAHEALGFTGLYTEGPQAVQRFPNRTSCGHGLILGASDPADIEAFLAEHGEDLEWGFRFDANEEDLRGFHREQRALYYLLVPDGRAFVLYNHSTDYWVLAGPRALVEAALGEPIEDVRAWVRQPGEFWIPDEEAAYLGYADAYEALDRDR